MKSQMWCPARALPVTFMRPVFFMENFNRLAPTADKGELVLRLPLPAGIPLQMRSISSGEAFPLARQMAPSCYFIANSLAAVGRRTKALVEILVVSGGIVAAYCTACRAT